MESHGLTGTATAEESLTLLVWDGAIEGERWVGNEDKIPVDVWIRRNMCFKFVNFAR